MIDDEDYEYEIEDDDDDDINFFDEDFDEESIPDRYAMPEAEDLIEEAIDMVAEARPLPMSATVKINRDDLLEILEQVQEKLPEELRAARWLLKERDDFVAKARQEHSELIEEGRLQVSKMVEREEVVKAANVRARQIISEARSESHAMKRQVEEFCEARLLSVEKIMEKTIVTMRKGRRKLIGSSSVSEDEVHASFSYESEINLNKEPQRVFEDRGY